MSDFFFFVILSLPFLCIGSNIFFVHACGFPFSFFPLFYPCFQSLLRRLVTTSNHQSSITITITIQSLRANHSLNSSLQSNSPHLCLLTHGKMLTKMNDLSSSRSYISFPPDSFFPLSWMHIFLIIFLVHITPTILNSRNTLSTNRSNKISTFDSKDTLVLLQQQQLLLLLLMKRSK